MHKHFRKGIEIGVGLVAISVLSLAGCGGGGGGSSNGSSTNNGSTTSSTSTTVTPFKGKYSAGTVTVKDANGNTVALISGGTIGSNGTATLTYAANVAYPLTLSVTGTYLDEVTNQQVTTTVPLRGLIPSLSDATAASGVPITAITNIARDQLPATGFTAASAIAAITASASSVLGVTSYAQAMLPPQFDATGKTSDPDTLKLVALAHVANSQGTGADLMTKLQSLSTQIANGSAVNAVIPQLAYQNALNAINGGASSVLPAGASAPVVTLPTLPNISAASAVASAASAVAAEQAVADRFVAASLIGLHNYWTINDPAIATQAVDYAHTATAGATAGLYNVSVTVKEQASGVWASKTLATETYPTYLLTSTGWSIPNGNATWQRQADNIRFTVSDETSTNATWHITEQDLSGTPLFDANGIQQGTYPQGSVKYVATSQFQNDRYRLFNDPWNVVTDSTGAALTALPANTATFCVGGTVMKPTTGGNYDVFFTAYTSTGGCTNQEITNALATTAAGTVHAVSVNTGLGGVSVYLIDSSATLPFMVNNILGVVTNKVYAGSKSLAGESRSKWLFNKTALNAELVANGLSQLP